jgi:Ca2+-binding EF-hand superfamily protein
MKLMAGLPKHMKRNEELNEREEREAAKELFDALDRDRNGFVSKS